MKRYVILCSGTRVYSGNLARRVQQTADGFSWNVLQPLKEPFLVQVIHGGCSGADEVIDTVAAVKGWERMRIPMVSDLGSIRNLAIVRIGRELVRIGYEPHVWCWPDDRSIGTRNFITHARDRGFDLFIEELGPRTASLRD